MADSFTAATVKLNSGDRMPLIGFGTWNLENGPAGQECVLAALKAGCRHIDTAAAYRNEEAVGAALRESGITRSDVWITTKLRPEHLGKVEEELDASLQRLGLEYVDLYLIHWPGSRTADKQSALPNWTNDDTWREMEKVKASGKARNIGVSNWDERRLEELLANPSHKVVPAVNQIEIHPLNPSHKLVAYCKSKDIHCTAYSPLGGHKVALMDNPTIVKVAEANGKTPAAVLLKWLLQRGISVIPRTSKTERARENFVSNDGWDLSLQDIDLINSITERRRTIDGSFMPMTMFVNEYEE